MTTKLNWIGLNRNDNLNTGELSSEKNISTEEYPYLTSAKKITLKKDADGYSHPLGIYAFGDTLITIYSNGNTAILMDIFLKDAETKNGTDDIKLTVNVALFGSDSESQEEYREAIKKTRTVSMFNQYTEGLTALDGTYSKKIVILPDKKSMPFEFEYYNGKCDDCDKNKLTYTENEASGGYIVNRWNGKEWICISGSDNELADLEVKLKNFYNDGYSLTDDDEPISGKEYFTRELTNSVYVYSKFGGTEFKSDTEYFEWTSEYEITSDTKVNSLKTYYTYIDGEYIVAENITEFESNTNYYERTDAYGPSSAADTSAYYFNTYNTMVYGYVTDEQADLVEDIDYTSGWKITSVPSFPDINYATVHQSRLFGVSDDMIFASGFNDYANWNYDTILDENANNAWYSTSQSNVKATGDFVGITVYSNHVIAFKRDFMHEIYNNKNPFRIVDIGSGGTIDNRSIQEVNGKLIFVSDSNVNVYTGSLPRAIGDSLGIDKFTYAVSGGDDRFYYLYCEDGNGDGYIFAYDTKIGAWSEYSTGCIDRVVGFATSEDGVYALCEYTDENYTQGGVYKITSDTYSDDWNFETDIVTGTTSSSTYESVNIKHIRKIQFLVTVKKGSSFKIYGKYDHDDEIIPDNLLYEAHKAAQDKTFAVRIKPRKTAGYGFKLYFEGSGYVKFGEIEVYMTKGGELFE